MKCRICLPSQTVMVGLLLCLGSTALVAQTKSSEPSVQPGINRAYTQPIVDVDVWVERFENEGREVYQERNRIVERMNLQPGMQVADIGAGSGLFTALFADAVGPTGKVYAVDIVQDFLDLIDKRSKAAAQSQVTTLLCTERSVELPPESIDLAFVCDTYHHFEYPQSSLASIHRALRPKGVLVLVEFVREPGKSSDWVLQHVRAGQEVFSREIEQAGFKNTGEETFLKDNYFLRFEKLEAPKSAPAPSSP